MANCPKGVPWQQVINSKGEISQRPRGQRQKELLLEEGVVFNEKGRVDLKKYGWEETALNSLLFSPVAGYKTKGGSSYA